MKKKIFRSAIVVILLAIMTSPLRAQIYLDLDNPDQVVAEEEIPDTAFVFNPDSIVIRDIYVGDIMLPDAFYRIPFVFSSFLDPDTISPLKQKFSDNPALAWVDKELYKINTAKRIRHNVMAKYPYAVRYNLNSLPSPPKRFIARVDPDQAIIIIEEVETQLNPEEHTVEPAPQKKYHWIKNFTGNIQFSQAYNSPNWYQGGNSHLNLLVNAAYNVKLNQTYHPNLLFETNIQYKLAVNSTPDDSLRKYAISEDLFQVNSKFGVRASKKWFYTLTLQAKTQFLNNYESNTNNMTAAFLSPGELNLGLGMTYTYENPKKTVNFTASISPASWNLRTCINSRMDPTQYDIKPGHKFSNEIGSSAEATLLWKMSYNISLKSRLFLFTDYSYMQGDWENTLNFTINKYLSTMLYVHLRYDSSTPPLENSKWHRWQLREVLSFGFAYTFATL